jgi:SOS-response transcriptional repressor LexA
MSTGKRIKEIRKELKKTQKEFANLLNVTQSNVNYYERDEFTPSLKVLQIIRKSFNINIDWLLTGEGNKFLPSPLMKARPENIKKKVLDLIKHELITLANDEGFTDDEKDDCWHLPRVGDISAGIPMAFAEDSDPWDFVAIPKSQLASPTDCDVLRVNGDSMEPKIEHSDFVVIKRCNDIWSCNNKVVAVRTADGLTLKRLDVNHEKQTAYLWPNNSKYEAIVFDEDCTLCGYLILQIRKY